MIYSDSRTSCHLRFEINWKNRRKGSIGLSMNSVNPSMIACDSAKVNWHRSKMVAKSPALDISLRQFLYSSWSNWLQMNNSFFVVAVWRLNRFIQPFFSCQCKWTIWSTVFSSSIIPCHPSSMVFRVSNRYHKLRLVLIGLHICSFVRWAELFRRLVFFHQIYTSFSEYYRSSAGFYTIMISCWIEISL